MPKDLTKLESIQDQECSAQRKVQKCSDRLGKRKEIVSFEFAPTGAPKNDVFEGYLRGTWSRGGRGPFPYRTPPRGGGGLVFNRERGPKKSIFFKISLKTHYSSWIAKMRIPS